MSQTFGKYQILEHIASGGTAEVYKARQEGIGGFQRTFAIKRIARGLSENSEFVEKLTKGAGAAGKLNHANVVQIVDLGQVDQQWYIAMEYIHGRDLGAVLAQTREEGLPVTHAAFIAVEILKALEYAHTRPPGRGGRSADGPIVHRHISPANILLSFSGEVKLSDFGIARATLEALESTGKVRTRHEYLSPEQAGGGAPDARSDLFSVGAVMYEMLTGHHPFRGATPADTLDRLRQARYSPMSTRTAKVPPALEAIVQRALAKDPNARFATATSFKEALDAYLHSTASIFTHATLASYLRTLFPEAARHNAHPPLSGEETEDIHELPPMPGTTPLAAKVTPVRSRRAPASEGPKPPVRKTTVASIPELDVELVSRNSGQTDAGQRAPGAPTRRPAFGDPSPADGSLARGTPLNPRSKATSKALDDGEHATVIRKTKDPAKKRNPDADRPTETPRDIEHATLIRKSGDSRLDLFPATGDGPTVAVAPVAAAPAAPQKRARGRSSLWLPLATGLFGVLAGLGASVAIAPIAEQGLEELQRLGISPIPAERLPHVEVIAPRDAEIRLDGEPVGKSFTVQPHDTHSLTIVPRGADPWTREISLGLDESRVYVVSPVNARARQANPQATTNPGEGQPSAQAEEPPAAPR